MTKTTKTTLRGRSNADLLAIPGILFGFHPHESLVALGMRGNRVLFGARMDIGASAAELTEALAKVAAVARRERCQGLVLLGFSRDSARVRRVLRTAWAVVGPEVAYALASDERRYWEFDGADLVPEEGVGHDPDRCVISAQAVYEGIHVRADRVEAVAEVLPPPSHELAELADILEDADGWVALLDADERMELLQQLLEAEDLGRDDAAALACLVQGDDALGEVLRLLGPSTCDRLRRLLVRARAVAVGEYEAHVVGLLGISCWLAGEGAQLVECLEQLNRLGSTSMLTALLHTLQEGAVPPSEWERWNHAGKRDH